MDNVVNGQEKEGPGRTQTIKIVRPILSLLLLLLLIAAALTEYLTLTEYRPEEVEEVAVLPGNRKAVSSGDTLRVWTWNCGYGALGSNADFFMDGGRGVYTADEERVRRNLEEIVRKTQEAQSDVVFFQEVDRRSDRSHNIDEPIYLINELEEASGAEFTSAYAYNFNVRFVPFPVPPIGRVKSGLLTLCSYKVDAAERYQLPCPFFWPVRTANFKRCLLVERIPVQNSGRSLVLVNIHLEAYDSGEGKAEQTRMLAKILRKEAESGNYVIAGGDFNQSFSNTDISAYPEMEGTWQPGRMDTDVLGSGWQCLMDNRVPTCRSLDRPYEGADPEQFQYYMIDGYIVSSNIEVRSCETQDLGFTCTDHNPVLMECVLK